LKATERFIHDEAIPPNNARSVPAHRGTDKSDCVRFATTVASAHATLATKQDATLYLGRTCIGWIAPALRLAHLLDYLIREREQGGGRGAQLRADPVDVP